ncbi:MAG: hypothetical protein ACSHW0_10725 [Thalassotalea sp.]
MAKQLLFLWCLTSLYFSVLGSVVAQEFSFPFKALSEEPPYYHVRYPASDKPDELVFAVNYTVWLPPQAEKIRAVIVHQHGCGIGAAYTGLTGAFDLHWQALAKKHQAALLSAAYEQAKGKPCPNWAEPRNGSEAVFLKALKDLALKSGHDELASAPWALWGHSGGAVWVGGMTLLHPERVVALWMRSGSFDLQSDSQPAGDGVYSLTDDALAVPIMLNQGQTEGITDATSRHAHVWPRNQKVFHAIRGKGGLIAHSVDLISEHQNGNQRYLAIPWFDAILSARLPKHVGESLRDMPVDDVWLAPLLGAKAVPMAEYKEDKTAAVWLPNKTIAKAWMSYMQDNAVADITPPPAPNKLLIKDNKLTWTAEADLESGLAYFIVERDGKFLAKVTGSDVKMLGRTIFQTLYNSDSPRQPLPKMKFTDTTAVTGQTYKYRVITVNTVGLKSN